MQISETLRLLQSVGLSENEARVYHALLVLGQAKPAEVAVRGGVKRPTAYVILNRLVDKDFATKCAEDGQEIFRAVNPHVIVERHEQITSKLSEGLPSLIALHPSYQVSPTITIFSGHSGIRHIWEDSLNASSDILYWADANLSEIAYLSEQAQRSTYEQSFEKKFVTDRISRGIWVRGIIPYETDERRLMDSNLKDRQKTYLQLKKEGTACCREFYFVSRSEFPFKHEINLFSDKMVLMSYQDLFGIVFSGDTYVKNYRLMFKAAFNYAKLTERSVLTAQDIAYLDSAI